MGGVAVAAAAVVAVEEESTIDILFPLVDSMIRDIMLAPLHLIIALLRIMTEAGRRIALIRRSKRVPNNNSLRIRLLLAQPGVKD
jgi:hypothetical protein